MQHLVVPQEGEDRLGADQSAAIQQHIQHRQRRDTIQSVIIGVLVLVLLGIILAFIAIIPWGREIPVIVAYSAPVEEEETPERPEMTHQARPRPAGPKSSRAKVIASQVPSPVAVPVPDNPVPEGPFGMVEEIGEGFGDSEGDGDGGGGSTFFGGYRKGNRAAFVVDYSGSMSSGSRISSLKKELERSILALDNKMQFTVIFFSSSAWHIGTEGPDYVGNGWTGAGKAPVIEWYPATPQVKSSVVEQLKKMPVDGGTMWYPPLKMALSMSPAPTHIYLLSDGDPRDGNSVLLEMGDINPTAIPIDTIAFELAGSPAAMLMEIAKVNRGRFSMVYQGKLLTGRAAEKYTSGSYD